MIAETTASYRSDLYTFAILKIVEASKQQQNLAAISDRLGLDTSAVLRKDDFHTPSVCSCEKPKARISKIEEGLGGLNCECLPSGWRDPVHMVQLLLRFPTMSEAAHWVAETIGFKIPPIPRATPPKDFRALRFLDWDEAIVQEWCNRKQPVTPRGLQRLGARLATYRCKVKSKTAHGKDAYEKFDVVAIPVWDPTKPAAEPVNWCISRIDGELLPAFDKTGNEQKPTKAKCYDGQRGIICDRQELAKVKSGNVPADLIVLKVEGVSDCACMLSQQDLPGDWFCWTNVFGCRDYAEDQKGILPLLASKTVHIVHDCDKSGQDSVGKWANKFAEVEAKVKHVRLPFEVTADSGKDIRDYFTGGGTIATLKERIEEAELVAGDASKAAGEKGSRSVLIEPDDPKQLAELNLKRYRETGRDLRLWRGNWYQYKPSRGWRPASEQYIRIRLRGSIDDLLLEIAEEETAKYWNGVAKGEIDPERKKPPRKRKLLPQLVAAVLDATKALVVMPDHHEPGYLVEAKKYANYWPVLNGLLDLDSYQLLPPSPQPFLPDYHDYQFNIEAVCPTWKQFLNEVFWNDETGDVDVESLDALQRWFGYCLTSTTRLQKMLVLDGVSRSGKGTILRVLKELLGDHNCASPRLIDLTTDFGLQPLLGKRLAAFGDVRLGYYANEDAILERLLGIVGEDSVDVNRKGMAAVTSQKISAKFMMCCNGIPVLKDHAMALANRMIVLSFRNSFAGREDETLTTRLLAEIDGIFLWAIEGHGKLQQEFKIPQPESGEKAIEAFKKQAAPIIGFVEEWCYLPEASETVGGEDQPAFITYQNKAYQAWCAYCEEIGRKSPGTKSKFIDQLIKTYPAIREYRPRQGEAGEGRPYMLWGIELSKEARDAAKRMREKYATAQPGEEGNQHAKT